MRVLETNQTSQIQGIRDAINISNILGQSWQELEKQLQVQHEAEVKEIRRIRKEINLQRLLLKEAKEEELELLTQLQAINDAMVSGE